MKKYACKICNSPFKPKRLTQQFCSYTCLGKSHLKRVLWKCSLCDHTEYKISCRAKESKYCKECCKGARYKGRLNGNWKGGRMIDRNGYVFIYKPEHPFAKHKKYVYEHRCVMEQHIGRYLKPEEHVHHINHNKIDNRIENLKLYASNSEHIKYEHSDITKKAQKAAKLWHANH